MFDQIYGRHYSKSSVSRMVECVRSQVNEWLGRGLESYYPVLFVDCVHIKTHRKRSVSCEAFHVALAVTEEGRREVLGIFNIPVESATGWGEIFDSLKDRGVEKVGPVVADGIKGLDTVVGEKFPGTPLQRCVTHLKRNMFAKLITGTKEPWQLTCVTYSAPDNVITLLKWPGGNGRKCATAGARITGPSNSCATTRTTKRT